MAHSNLAGFNQGMKLSPISGIEMTPFGKKQNETELNAINRFQSPKNNNTSPSKTKKQDDEDNAKAVRDQIILTSLKGKIQVNHTKITDYNMEFEPPEILNLENIKNIEAIKGLLDQNDKKVK